MRGKSFSFVPFEGEHTAFPVTLSDTELWHKRLAHCHQKRMLTMKVHEAVRGTENPAPGQFTFGVDLQGYPQLVLRTGTRILYRVGSWNGQYFTGFPQLKPNPIYTFEFVVNQNEVYFKFELRNSSVFSRLTMNPSGLVQRFTWSDQTNDWKVFATAPVDQCENYALCGANALCDSNSSPVCACLDGFIPKFPSEWNSQNWTAGCIRRTPLDCTDEDGFQSYAGVKLPDTSSSWFDNSSTLVECEGLCIHNCSCFAYANLDIRGRGSGCLQWFGDLIDTRKLPEGGQDIYLRLAASESGVSAEKRRKKKTHAGLIGGAAILGSSILIIGIVFCVRRRKHRKNDNFNDMKEEDMELPMHGCFADSYTPSEALRCLHVALLCVQQRPEDRPNMSSVVLMLGSENPLPQPKQPGFFMGSNPPEKDTSSNKHQSYTANEVTVTQLHARKNEGQVWQILKEVFLSFTSEILSSNLVETQTLYDS
ncbi:hypothetical protein SADUNF_Sadunf16G0272800 [Salix dunnii]|uniref:Apple domain-containing protein n=1 Tax=Salix dunnii TaxID=1413687 RepID=A0A835MMX7_9ROSI|nr:hypothetical protein SADUNF_Sadunf16G0272800 [Salix dunnii]